MAKKSTYIEPEPEAEAAVVEASGSAAGGTDPQPVQPELQPPPPLPIIPGTPYIARRVLGKSPAIHFARSRYAHREWIRNWKQFILMRGYR
jgi:hypothetical protein